LVKIGTFSPEFAEVLTTDRAGAPIQIKASCDGVKFDNDTLHNPFKFIKITMFYMSLLDNS